EELPDVAAKVPQEPAEHLDVARLVPGLTRHVHGELPRRVGEVVDGATGPLHRLELADEDPVNPLPDRLHRREVGHPRQALLGPDLPDPARAHADEAVLPRELVVGNRPIHGPDSIAGPVLRATPPPRSRGSGAMLDLAPGAGVI